ncbi:triphosphoribosyl-dephospho-CoA synthase CitG [Vagococcus sp. BWB3-3]|uniref:Probable 2-(5''-triphosphoribosyl)-3'-dephosphocoenzyme-A synthase n=1 Tax=Vagococcus allomyrinae TaxID=2794353 RepID=A0A940P7R3_9ENTE|nr:triphosphoribosyl-dephospho-CoA synthase CitG [Vagococcus allomyrinae]MBP1043219.1 triphosphoribosyl-dephospho-CoA synthase CitG [Vagococcus allomyrinae]
MTQLINQISQYAQQALLHEAALFPKPGLVDPLSNGAHDDMSFLTFIDSSIALSPFLSDYLALGHTHQGTPQELFAKIRRQGILAEEAMLQVTAGINTHKGANFSFALILGAIGYYIQQQPDLKLPFKTNDTLANLMYVALMSENLIQADYADLVLKEDLSAGERLYLEHGFTGIRGEAAAGYPMLRKVALPFLRKQPAEKRSFLLTMLLLMGQVEDSNLIHRGGVKSWLAIKENANQLYVNLTNAPLEQIEDALRLFDQQLISQHVSPGGTADLLALALFFSKLEGR